MCKLEDDIGTLVPLKRIWITQDVGIESTVCISVAQFTPKPEDKTGYVWMGENGANTMEMPHYWITNIQEARRDMSEYIQRSVDEYIELALKGSDGILRDTFVIAKRVALSGDVSFFCRFRGETTVLTLIAYGAESPKSMVCESDDRKDLENLR